MGETIRCLMVAVVALISMVGIEPTGLVAQGPSGGFEIPKSLSGAFGETTQGRVENDQRAGGSASSSIGLPNFTSGVAPQRVGPRTGGPTTEPMSSRDRAWLSELARTGQTRPTTDPVESTGFGAQTSSAIRNDLRTNQNPNTIATVGATQDPQSREAQLMAAARDNGSGSNNAGTNTTGGSSRGFGSLPPGVQLPNQSDTSTSTSTFGSEFARGGASSSTMSQPSNVPTRPVFGPPTAQEANFDLSVYNANNRAAQHPSNTVPRQTFGQNTAGTTAQQNLTLPGQFGGTSAPSGSGVGGSSLGMPAMNLPATTTTAAATQTADPRATAPSLPTSWTYDQIAQLGRLFGIEPTDPRMRDKAFVNDLYVGYREHQAKQQSAAQTAITSNNQTQFTSPQIPSLGTPSQPFGTAEQPTSDPRFANLNGATTAATATDPWGSAAASSPRPTDVDPRLSQKDIDGLPPGAWSYDKYGNPIDKERYVLDRFGQRVDEETQWELTIGRKRRLEEERLARLDAERARLGLSSESPSSRPGSASDLAVSGGQSAAPVVPTSGSAPATRPRDGANEASGLGNRVPPADQAGIGGAAGAIGRSNPYVNVFLLCSLVANAFLFISLHRLWYHHRDLIASSRMAASGMSSND
ncbi:hypothetical protein Mal15_39080 [Stieleria maiorica]|uniref:Uncharacterized protein n=1 Tax=Stieleria maiorica TaxID=2795974 RepID=A0A5B9MEY5_9BACT|nr:hypothetical protein [Stieleria maiorica]QEF99841.1 hypothetical protein Mal15_39080 [Stieleria maiorica]